MRLYLRSTLKKSWQIEWDVCFNWYAEAYKHFQGSKIASLKDLLEKANERVKTQKTIERA